LLKQTPDFVEKILFLADLLIVEYR